MHIVHSTKWSSKLHLSVLLKRSLTLNTVRISGLLVQGQNPCALKHIIRVGVKKLMRVNFWRSVLPLSVSV